MSFFVLNRFVHASKFSGKSSFLISGIRTEHQKKKDKKMKQTVVIKSIGKTFANSFLHTSEKPTTFVGYSSYMKNYNNNTRITFTATMQCCCISCMP